MVRSSTIQRTSALLLLATLALIAASCAEEREPINRVQPYALEKSYFVGEDLVDPRDDPEFYTQGTLIDVGYGAAQSGLFTSTYAQPLSRIRWEITETMLIGRISYERIPGTDGKGLIGENPVQDGVIAVAYPIKSHFDIINAYNPTTGEKLNVLNENTSDRPWYERENFRIDWSQNLATDSYDFDTLSMMGLYGGLRYEPMAYDITNPSDPNAPMLDDMANGYFDITNKAFVAPQMIDLRSFGWGIDEFPACFLDPDFLNGTGPAATCNPVELTIRQAFRRIEKNDYEPAEWDGYRFQAYGAFFNERQGFARNYGLTDDQWHRMINRYNIWDRNHYYTDPENMEGGIACFTDDTTPYGSDPHRDTDGDGTEDECAEAGAGSRCDTFKQLCTLPYQERVAVTTNWYYATDSDFEYFKPTRDATHEWDVALRHAVMAGKFAECVHTNSGSCASRFPILKEQQNMNEDLVFLAAEVDDCREGIAYTEMGGDEEQCKSLADSIGAKRNYDAAVIEMAKMDEMLVLCHSPVESTDPPTCASEDRRLPEGVSSLECVGAWKDRESDLFAQCKNAIHVRRGDLRYHAINAVSEPATPSPWGIMVDAIDPLTGESISASINVWTYVNDLWSQGVVDRARYVKGELKTEDITEGQHVRNWSQASEASLGGSGISSRLTKAQVKRRVADFTGSDATQNLQISDLPIEVARGIKEIRQELKQIRASLDAPSANRAIYAARAREARGSSFEAELMTPMVQEMMGVAGMPLSDGVLDRASLLRGGNPNFLRDINNWKEIALAERGACIMQEAPTPHSITGLSDILETKFGAFNASDSTEVQQDRAEKMRKYLAHRADYAVIVHEMGHSIGLRHNFVSSSDAFNYRPQYWQLRTQNGTETSICNDLTADGGECVGPRYFDPVTKNERDNMIWMFMHSSVMDYAGEYTQDTLGLGVYDFAAARMFYGNSVATYTNPEFKAGTSLGSALLDKTDNFGGILGISWSIDDGNENSDDGIHYSELNNHFNLIKDCYEVDVNDYIPASYDPEAYGTWHPTLDGRIVSVGGKYTRCHTQEVSHTSWDDLAQPTEEQASFFRGSGAVTPSGNLRVPYGFATDGWADLGNLSVYRHDNGADAYEIFDFFISQQEINHIFDHYRRGKSSFSIRRAANRALGRYNMKMRDGAKGLSLFRNIYKDFAHDIGFTSESLWSFIATDSFNDNILASGMAFDHFTRLTARPEHGPHYFKNPNEADPTKRILVSERDAVGNVDPDDIVVTIPNGATGYFESVGIGGQPVENQLADDKGEFDSRYVINAGSYYDKLYTSMLLTESVDNFISSSRRDFTDGRYRAVSMADLFPNGYRRWLANNLTGDTFIKGPRIQVDASGNPVTDADGYPSNAIGWTSWWGSEPRVCFPGNGTTICSSFGNEAGTGLDPLNINNTVAIDPQVGWEQQKFLVAWTLMYLMSNQKLEWLNSMRVWVLGQDADPEFENRIEYHHPMGEVYVARTEGTEVIFGKTVQKGISARMLEYANSLIVDAYETLEVDFDGDGVADWYQPVIGADGQPLVKWDSSLSSISQFGLPTAGRTGCNSTDNSQCICSDNIACVALENYVPLISFMREATMQYGLGSPRTRGIY